MRRKETEIDTVERHIMECLSHAWNNYSELPKQHPHEATEFMTAIHSAQRVIEARRNQRREPEFYE